MLVCVCPAPFNRLYRCGQCAPHHDRPQRPPPDVESEFAMCFTHYTKPLSYTARILWVRTGIGNHVDHEGARAKNNRFEWFCKASHLSKVTNVHAYARVENRTRRLRIFLSSSYFFGQNKINKLSLQYGLKVHLCHRYYCIVCNFSNFVISRNNSHLVIYFVVP